MGVFVRGTKLWITFKNAAGKWQNSATGCSVGQEEQAQAMLEDVLDEVRKAQGKPGLVVAALTLAAYADTWIEDRRKLDLDWKNDQSRLKHHVLPRIGPMKIADVRARHIVDLFKHIRTTPIQKTKEKLELPSQRLVYNIYSVVSAMFRDAKLADYVAQTPCELDARQLGPLKDKDPEWRSGAVFTREEVETIISSPDIPADRHMVYALELLAGIRPGEAAALRWRHYDASTDILGKLTVALSYNTRKNRAKGTKTDVVKFIPVHPTLAAMLAEWKLNGWEAMNGRAPEPEDLIVPLPPKAADRRRTREGEPHRGHDYSGKKWREKDLPALGWRHRRHYDMRATFITLAIEDGADPQVIEERVTHTKKGRSAFKGYDRGVHWGKTCTEIAKLKIVRKVQHGTVIQLPIAVGDDANAPYSVLTASTTSEDNNENGWRRRESKQARSAEHSIGRHNSQHVARLAVLHSTPHHSEPVRSPLQQPDPIADEVIAAVEQWRRGGDRRVLRRALMKVLGDLD